MKNSFLDRLLGALGAKQGKKKKKNGAFKRKGNLKAKTAKLSLDEHATPPAPAAAPVTSLDAFIDQLSPAPEPVLATREPVALEAVVAAAEPVAPPQAAPPSALEQALQSGDAENLRRVVESMAQASRSLRRFAHEKRQLFSSYQAQLERAIAVRDFMTLAFMGSSLIVDAAFFRDDLLGQASQIADLSDQVLGMPAKKAQTHAAELTSLVEAFQAGFDKKRLMVENLDAKLIKAHQAKDFASLSDITSALSRDALILSSLNAQASDVVASGQTGLTATSSAEKAAQIDRQVAQLHQAILDRQFLAIADIARMVSLNAGVLADPSTSKAAQILQLGQQLQASMRSAQDHPANAMLCANLSKVASVFNGPLMDKANQLEAQVAQLQAALKAFDQNKMFTLSVTIARSSAILTDATIQKASLLAGFVPRIDISLKRKDFAGATSALKSALS